MILSSIMALAPQILVIVLCVNAVLSGVKVALDKLSAVISAPGVAKADSLVGTVLSWLTKIIDFLSANIPH